MSKQCLLWQFGLTLAILTGFNFVVQRSAVNSVPRQLLQKIARTPQADCVFLGNSLVAAGCDLGTFISGWPVTSMPKPKPINLGLGSSSPVEHCLIFGEALKHLSHLNYVIYGFYDTQLTEAAPGSWQDLVGNRALAYTFPEAAASYYAPGSLTTSWRLWLMAKIPMVVDRYAIWSKVELIRRELGELGLRKAATNRFGRVADFQAIEADNTASFARICADAVETNRPFWAPIASIIQKSRERGTQIFLVEMPMPSRHRMKFQTNAAWRGYQEHLQKLAASADVVYVPASDWIDDADHFDDFVHLNESGAQTFSAQLARFVASHASNNPQ